MGDVGVSEKMQGNSAAARQGFSPGSGFSPEEFLELYERHRAIVYRAARRITGNSADAEDVLQTVFIQVYRRGIPPDVRAADAWLRRMAANAAIDILRRRAAHAEVRIHDVRPETARPFLVQKPEALLKERLRRALAKLQPPDAELFLLRFVEGFSNGELAGLLGQTKSNIAVRLYRIRQTLQDEMNQ